MAEELVILVDHDDNEVGTSGKMDAHRLGLLHRAISVFVFNEDNEMLIHQRAEDKYHSGGLWTNACCSHPRPGEKIDAAARRRLEEEMGIVCKVDPVFKFQYRAELDNDLIEHEFDHVFIARFNNDPVPDPLEVQSWKWIGVEDLKREVKTFPQQFTPWFRIALPKVIIHNIQQ